MTLQKKEKKTMLYIFRYFKEIQKSIFVIKTMFEMVLFDWFMCAKVCEELSYVFPSFFCPSCFVPLWNGKSPCYTKAVLSVCSCLFWHTVWILGLLMCVFVWRLCLMKQKCWSFVWCAFRSTNQAVSGNETKTPDPAHNFAVWGDQMCERGIDRNKPSLVKVEWPRRLQNMANWAQL